MSNQPAVLGPDGIARPYIGGQALIEGVMMRSPHAFAAVCRRKSGELVVREAPMLDTRSGKRAWPLIRGVAALVEALRLGSRALRFSIEIYERDLDEADRAKSPPPSLPSTLTLASLPIVALLTSEAEPGVAAGKAEKGRGALTALSILLAIGLFIALPQFLASGANWLFGFGLDLRSAGFQVLTGVAKMLILVGYMFLIRQSSEFYRMFQYHGAEHKSIYTYESGEELSVENARPKTTLHPRCGTTFLVMVAMVSIVVFSALAPLLPSFGESLVLGNVLLLLLKLPFLPLIAAITFELQRVFARFATKGPLRVLLWPGFLVQKITTIEPDDEQLEVALGALAVTLGREQRTAAAPEAAPDSERRYPNYSELLSGAA